MEEKLRYHYHYHHNYQPPPVPLQLLQMKRWGRKVGRRNLRKLSHTLTLAQSRPVILGGITNRMQGLKFNYSAVYGNLK